MKFHYSLEHANKVLARVKREMRGFKSSTGEHVYIEVWANGREQGYCIKVYGRGYDGYDAAICFAQTRNGNSVVVIAGPFSEFDPQNQPSEDAWANNYKNFNDDKKAAEHIVHEIIRALEPVAAKMMEGS